jgi:hypothetical protein
MAAPQGPFSGTIATVLFGTVAPVIAGSAPTDAELDTWIGESSTNQVPSVESIGDITNEANLIEFSQLGEEYSSSIAGQRTPGQLELTVTFDPSNAVHTAIRDTSSSTNVYVAIRFTDGANVTTFYTPARVLNSNVTGISADSQVQMTVAFARMGGGYWADAS